MGTALYYNEEGRAAKIAKSLKAEGYGVLWRPHDKPQVVMTAASKEEVDVVSKRYRGVVDEWWKMSEIDAGSSEQRIAERKR